MATQHLRRVKRAHGGCQVFKEWFITILWKPSRLNRILVWLSTKVMTELQCKKQHKGEAGPGYKGGIWKHCQGMQRWCHKSQRLSRKVKGNKKNFCDKISSKRLNEEHVRPLLNGAVV